MIRRYRQLLAAVLLALSASPVFAATAYLQPAAIFEGDITELVIEYESNVAALYALDTGPLAADFEILDIKSRVFRIDQQDSRRHRMQWRLQLLPRSTGSLLVPALRLADQVTSPLPLEVKPVPEDMRSSQEVFVELDSEPRSPYVGQQTLLRLRLIHNTPLRIDGLAEPRLSDAASYRDIDEKVYFVERDGQQFRVLERQILMFPRQAGMLELPPAVLRGQLRPSSPADAEGEAANRKISRSSNPLWMEVRAPPGAHSGRYWLPAYDLLVSQRLQPPATGLRIGDSIDWTLTLEATGLPAASLPANLLEREATNYTVYADQPRRSDRLENGELIGLLKQRFAIIVTAAGAIELPPVNLAWWDLAADRERQARVEGAHLGFAQGAVTFGDQQVAAGDEHLLIRISTTDRGWIWPLLSLATVVLLLLALQMLERRFARPFDLLLRRWRIRRLLRQACHDNQAQRARALLIEWGRARWPDATINGLYPLRELCGSARLVAELDELDAALFSAARTGWRGADLWSALAAGRDAAADSGYTGRLPGLYPD